MLYKAAADGVPTLTDKGYAGAGIGVHSPVKGRDLDVWPFIRDLFTSSEPVAEGDKHALAETILSRVQLYPGLGPANEFPSPAGGTPTPGGGYVFWAQDYEFTRNVTPTDEAYAGVLAVMWAGKQILSDSMKIFPARRAASSRPSAVLRRERTTPATSLMATKRRPIWHRWG